VFAYTLIHDLFPEQEAAWGVLRLPWYSGPEIDSTFGTGLPMSSEILVSRPANNFTNLAPRKVDLTSTIKRL
jgi:hypothetical protein